jgi:hypothetical protein
MKGFSTGNRKMSLFPNREELEEGGKRAGLCPGKDIGLRKWRNKEETKRDTGGKLGKTLAVEYKGKGSRPLILEWGWEGV